MTREALRTKMMIALLVLILGGITAGALLVRGPIDIRNRAAEPNSCEAPVAICEIDTDRGSGPYDDFVIEIINKSTNELIKTGGINATSVDTPVVSGTEYICRIKGVTGGGAKRNDCPINEIKGTAPVCSGPTLTPVVPSTPPPSPSPTIFEPTPTPFNFIPTPTGAVFPGCPINIRNIDPILCVIDSEGRCLSPGVTPVSCSEIRDWKCALSAEDKALLDSYGLLYRLAVYGQDGGIKATTPINDTRDSQPDQTDIKFPAQTGSIYTCKLEVFDDTQLNPTICAHMSGRLRCTGITPPVSIPTTPVSIPSIVITPPTTITTCVQSSGDLNRDGNIDTRDVNLFVRSQFSQDNLDATDVNCDRKVDSSDWSLLFTRVFGQ